MNRRGFLKTAAGLLVAAGAGELLLPERRVWALGGMPERDLLTRQTMGLPPVEIWAGAFDQDMRVTDWERQCREAYMREKLALERHIIYGEPLSDAMKDGYPVYYALAAVLS